MVCIKKDPSQVHIHNINHVNGIFLYRGTGNVAVREYHGKSVFTVYSYVGSIKYSIAIGRYKVTTECRYLFKKWLQLNYY